MQRAKLVLSVNAAVISTYIDEAVNATADKQKCIDVLAKLYLGHFLIPETRDTFFDIAQIIESCFDDSELAITAKDLLIKKINELLAAENKLPEPYANLPHDGFFNKIVPLYSPAQFLVWGPMSKSRANCLVTANRNFHEMTADQWLAFGHALKRMGIIQINLSANKLAFMQPDQWRGFKEFLAIAELHWIGFNCNQLDSLLPDYNYVAPKNADFMRQAQPKPLSAEEKALSLKIVDDIYKTTKTTLDLCSWDEGDKKFMAHIGFSPAEKLRAQPRI